MVWPSKQNDSGTASHAIFKYHCEWEEASWTTTNKMAGLYNYIKDLNWNRLGHRLNEKQSVFADQEL